MKTGTKVVETFGFNKVLQKPFQFIYDFGYNSPDPEYYVLYLCGECNMQDAHLARKRDVRIATEEDLKNIPRGLW